MNDHNGKLPAAELKLLYPCDGCGQAPATKVVFDWLFLCAECADLVRLAWKRPGGETRI